MARPLAHVGRSRIVGRELDHRRARRRFLSLLSLYPGPQRRDGGGRNEGASAIMRGKSNSCVEDDRPTTVADGRLPLDSRWSCGKLWSRGPPIFGMLLRAAGESELVVEHRLACPVFTKEGRPRSDSSAAGFFFFLGFENMESRRLQGQPRGGLLAIDGEVLTEHPAVEREPQPRSLEVSAPSPGDRPCALAMSEGR